MYESTNDSVSTRQFKWSFLNSMFGITIVIEDSVVSVSEVVSTHVLCVTVG